MTLNFDESSSSDLDEAHESAPTTDASTTNIARLMISHIEAENFKSYAGKRYIGPFHQRFTSIIGPNGSGKSNVIDAMLFVFGYRARKIRSKKLSVLIHNSRAHQNIRSCKVTVFFQQIKDISDDEFEVVAGSEFSVARTATKDNTSDYYINEKKATFREVTDLLRKCGIDLDHNRFLILQGEVEQIALMKPKAQTEHDEGMLEFLEDIMGTSQYKEPIEQLQTEYQELHNTRGEKVNRLRAVEKELSELESAKNEAMEYLKQKDLMARVHFQIYNKNIYEINMQTADTRSQLEEVNESLRELTQALKEKLSDIKSSEQDLSKQAKLIEAMNEATEKKNTHFSECEKRDVKVREEEKRIVQNMTKLKKNIEKEKQKLEDLKTAPERLTEEIKVNERKKIELEKDLSAEESKLESIMSGLKESTQGLQKEKEKKEVSLMQVKERVDKAKSKQDMSQTEYDVYMKKVREQQSSIKDKQFSIDDVKKKLQANEAIVDELQRKIPQQKQEILGLENELQQYGTIETNLETKYEVHRSKLAESKSSFSAHKSRGKLLEALLMAKESKHIPGIIGRLGDLASIDEKYDVAISTACPSLEYILVGTVDTGTKAISFLKEHKLGVTTFMSLDKMEIHREQANRNFEGPPGVSRMFDLLKIPDDKLKSAFYFALRDMLVTENIELATEIGMRGAKRYRVVTLTGELVEQSGAMSGGGARVARGRMSSRVQEEISPEQLETLSNNTAKIKYDLEELQKKKKAAENRLIFLKNDISGNETKLQTASLAVNFCRDQLKSLESQLCELHQNVVTVDPKQVEHLESNLNKHQKAYKQVLNEFQFIEEDVKTLEDKINAMGADKVQKQQSLINTAKKNLDETKNAISKAQAGITSNDRNITKCEEKIESLESDLTEAKTNKEKNAQDLLQIEEDVEKILSAHEEAIKDQDKVEEQINNLKNSIAKIKDSKHELTEKENDLKHKQEDFQNYLNDAYNKIKQSKAKIKNLKFEGDPPAPPTDEELSTFDKSKAKLELTVQEDQLASMKPNLASIDEYKNKEEIYNTRLSEVDAITEQRDEKKMNYENLRKRRLDEFMYGFGLITIKLKEMYQMLTLGGDAELELVDTLDPFSEGIALSVRPPKKSWKNIKNLSGGEKTLSSLALIFALHQYKPSPLYIMDEIDAALDFRNVSLVGYYIKERTKNSQFIVISLRNYMFELADRLVGIYKTHDITKCVSLVPNQIVQSNLNISSFNYSAINDNGLNV